MTVRAATEKVICAPADASVSSVAQQMRAHRVGCVVIVSGKRPVGIVTDRDLALRIVAESLPGSTPVSEVMSPDPVTADQGAGIETILRALRNAGTRRLPLVNKQGDVVAIITHDDLVQLLARELRNLGEGVERSADASDLR